MAKFVFTRALHEESAIRAIADAKRELPRTHAGCSPESVMATIRANRDIARARTHLASIGGDEGKRTRKIWGALGKMERQIDSAGSRMAKCLLK